jgi:hypothetical protein
LWNRWWRLERREVFTNSRGAFAVHERVQSLPLEVIQTVEGPRERSARAEAAASELEREFLNDDPDLTYGEGWRESQGDVDWAARAREDAARMIKPVGTWWDEVIAERVAPSRTD